MSRVVRVADTGVTNALLRRRPYSVSMPVPMIVIWLGAVALLNMASAFTFEWPNVTRSCDVINLTWFNGTPPFSVWIVPINSQLFEYDLPDSAFSYGKGTYEISLQLSQDEYYTVLMNDKYGIGTGGSTEIQIVQPSNNTACIPGLLNNITSLDFTFEVVGDSLQCTQNMSMGWSGGLESGPYSATFIPLDQSFTAFTLDFKNNKHYATDILLNITEGSRFTVLMSSQKGWGRGGIDGVFSVAPSDDTACLKASPLPTGTWPTLIATETLDGATLAPDYTVVPSQGLTPGGIAGIVIGIVVGVILLTLLVVFLVWRRRRRARGLKNDHGLDLHGGPMIEPFTGAAGTVGSGPSVGQSINTASMTDSVAGLAPVTSARTPGHTEPSSPVSTRAAAWPNYGAANLSGAIPPPSPDDISPSSNNADPLPLKQSLLNMPYPLQPYPSQPYPHSSFVPTPPQSHTPLHIVNDDTIAAAAAANAGGLEHDPPSRPATAMRQPRRVAIRRHSDAGRLDYVDLPPLYTDVPRDGPYNT